MIHPSARLLTAALTLLAALATGCANQKFASSQDAAKGTNANITNGPGDTATGAVNQVCSNQLQQLTVPIKLLFVVDTSGSNASDPGTDPNKVVRGQSIQEFFNNYKAKTNFNWAFDVFAGSSSSALIGSSSSQPMFTATASVMQGAINNFLGITDAGQTPYMAALNLAQVAIQNDTNRTSQTRWVIVFLSDGMPNPDVDINTLDTKVNTIINLIPGQITFNTVYYGPSDAAAAARLQSMASAGSGKFLNTNNNIRSFAIEDVISVPGTACH